MADSDPTLPPPLPPDNHSATDHLTQSMRNSHLRRDSSPASSVHAGKLTPSPRTLSRRASLDIRSAASSPAPGQRSQAPSTPPTIRKRASLASLTNGHYDGGMTPPQPVMRRRSSLLSLRDPPAGHVAEPPVKKDMTPPPQDPYATTTVILHDTSYKHRYSRPKTSQAELASIVERPERIPAAVLGICAAQVRAGKERLSINKSTRQGKLSDPEVMLVHAHTPVERTKKNWPDELVGMCAAAGEKLKRGQVEVPSSYHQGDLYLCGGSLEDLEGCIGAVYDGVDAVFGNGPVTKSFVCIRPPGHHCAEREPSGFCWLNNVHIAIAHAARQHGLTHAAILDFDLHHGDGSQAIAWSINELAASGSTAAKKTQGLSVPKIGYFSLHDINSYPCENGDKNKIQSASINLEAHGQFIRNIHLKPYGTSNDFWNLYNQLYTSIFTKARSFLMTAAAGPQKKDREFKAGVFLSAGFDASEHESPGMQRHKVNVPTDFFAKFTADAVSLSEELCGGRVVSVLEGGYSDRALTSGVFAHISGLSCTAPDRVGFVPSSISLSPYNTYAERQVIWDPSWWSVQRLQELERLTAKVPKKAEPKKTSYMDATTASIARISETPRRVSSSSFGSSSASPAPPPLKPWEVQAYELSKYFIPTFEESIPIPAVTKAKPQRHSFPDAAPRELTMKLRDRKPKVEPAATGRRTTVAGPVLESRNVSRAPSRVNSRATTPAPTSRAGTPALTGKPVTTASTGATIAGPRPLIMKAPLKPAAQNSVDQPAQQLSAAVDVDELSGKLARVKITFCKEKAEREELRREEEEQSRLEQLEREKAEIEERLERARREGLNPQVRQALRRASGGSIPRPVTSGGAVAKARRKLEATTPPTPTTVTEVLEVATEMEDSATSQSSGRSSLPSSPPQIQLNNADLPGQLGDNALGHFHGVVRSVSPGTPGVPLRDRTFKGGPGEIRFGQRNDSPSRNNGLGAFGGV